MIIEVLLVYYIIISLVTAIVTFYDKKAAKKYPKRRIREATLFLLALLGGALVEYAVMKKFRHKTQHKSFMIGLPLIIILHIILLIAIYPYIPMPLSF